MVMKGLIFDIDGVIADTEPICARAASAMFRKRYGAVVPETAFRAHVGSGPPRYLGNPARDLGLDIDLDEAWADCADRFLKLLDAGPPIAFPGVQDFLREAFVRPGWKPALATSTPEHKSRKTLKAAGVNPRDFSAYIHGDAVTRHKPDPEIYLAAATALGLSPTRCVAIEDAVNGIRAAKGAGMGCIAITNSFPREGLAEADRVVDRITDVTWEMLDSLVPNHGE